MFTLRGFQLRNITDRLALDILKILHEALTETSLNYEQLSLRIVLTLSENHYVEQLLFRDFMADKETRWFKLPLPGGQVERIHDQAVTYFTKVLTNRLQLVNQRGRLPTNMHLLLKDFCQQGSPYWKSVEIRRDQNLVNNCQDQPFFQEVAQALASQCQKLNHQFSQVSHRRREQYGPLWLLLGDCAAELPEELSLFFDVLQALPLPLPSNFIDNSQLQQRLHRVLENLNERYLLLRSCGLNPDTWIEREVPSTDNLRKLKRLRKRVQNRWSENLSLPTRYQQVFKELQGEQKKFAGFTNFEEFMASEIGQAMLNYPMISFHEEEDSEDEKNFQGRVEDRANFYAVVNFEESVTNACQRMQKLVAQNPDLFNPVMSYLFQKILGCRQPLPRILHVEFRQLIENDSRYAHLSDEKLRITLLADAKTIIQQGIRRCQDRSPK